MEWELLRNKRNQLLAESDWVVMPDSPISESKQSEWKTYRQALRDLPKGANPKLSETIRGFDLDPDSVTFPTKPS
tara:strand:+ start:670 stop:894 length:225 start_codon:yes stop_codon:yes gene_type:complete